MLTLGNHRLHGYAIRKELERRTDGEVTILPGTLYSSISRMLDDGLIRETSAAPADGKRDSRRRYYQVTDLGKQVAAAESQRLALLLDLAKAQRMTAAEPAIRGELEQLGAATPRTTRRRFAIVGGTIGLAAAAAVAFLLVPRAPQVENPTAAPGHRGPVLTLRAPPLAVAPAGLVQTPIQFVWTSVPGADRYELTLFDNMASILWDTQTTDTVVVVPDSVGLAPGSSYFWKAEALIGFDRWSESDLVEFRLVTRPDSTS